MTKNGYHVQGARLNSLLAPTRESVPRSAHVVRLFNFKPSFVFLTVFLSSQVTKVC